MNHDDFIGLVQQRARLDSRGAAEQATRATLTTLAERFAEGLPGNLADQLPPEIGRHLAEHEGTTERFGPDEFYTRVADRQTSGIGVPDAALHTRAVLSVVAEAVDDSLFAKFRDQFPPELSDLLEFEDLASGDGDGDGDGEGTS